MRSKFFVILGSQLFNPKILKKNGCSEVFMAEDFGLCTYFKHHKLKLYLFLAGMREYRDELENESISVNYFELSTRKKGESYVDSLIKFLKKKNQKLMMSLKTGERMREMIMKNIGLQKTKLIKFHQYIII